MEDNENGKRESGVGAGEQESSTPRRSNWGAGEVGVRSDDGTLVRDRKQGCAVRSCEDRGLSAVWWVVGVVVGAIQSLGSD